MLAKYFSFKGRLNRKPFWLMHLILYLILLAFFGLVYFVMGGASAFSNGDFFGGSMLIISIIAIVFMIALYVSTISITVRRMHDRNYSGWWLLAVFVFFMAVGGVGEMFKGSEILEIIIGLIAIVISIWYMVEVGFRKGTMGPNNFGPDPISGSVADPEIFGGE